MTLKQIKDRAHDCKKVHRWAVIDKQQYRIIGIGQKYVRVMGYRGEIQTVEPADISEVW